MSRFVRPAVAAALCVCLFVPIARAADPKPKSEPAAKAAPAPISLEAIKSAGNGPWSAPATWTGGKVPGAGDRVLVRAGHTVTYDVESDKPVRVLHVAGTLTFATDRNTRLDVGVLRVQPGENVSDEGFACDAHMPARDPSQPRATLLVGTADKPVEAGKTALIKLTYLQGLDDKSCPAVVACGGRMEFHGAPLSRSWVKLGRSAAKGDAAITLAEAVTGWRVGDAVIVTATHSTRDTDGTRRAGKGDQEVFTEDRIIKAIDGAKLTLDRPLDHAHAGEGLLRGEVANLSRNVIVESAEAAGHRGHVMYHVDSAAAISYAEFRHLGKENVLGRYSVHFHLCGDTMRGSYVVGASIHDSHNRWITVHGTNHLVVRDVVGYRSVGHGFFLEDGTEVDNVFDRCLAVQAYVGKRLPSQVLPFDPNDGAGFWWANSLNTFVGCVSCENDRYGFRFDATVSSRFSLTLPIRQSDGSMKETDIRTLPFVRFDDNEAHCDGRYAFNLGEGVRFVGPDAAHPFIIRNMKIWEVHYGFRVQSPMVLAENMMLDRAAYGIYHPNYDHHVYRNLSIAHSDTEPFNRGHDDASVQNGPLAVDGLTFTGHRFGGMPLIQISDTNATGKAVSHFRNVKIVDAKDNGKRALVNRGGGPRPEPKSAMSVPVYVHDWFGPGRTARVESTAAKGVDMSGSQWKPVPGLTGDQSRASEVTGVEFPKVLDPVDDRAPTTVITHVSRVGSSLRVRGTTADNGTVVKVIVNGKEAKATAANHLEWEIEIEVPADGKLTAQSTDAAGNVEKLPHTVTLDRR